MSGFLASFGMVAIAEIGDKTQLLSFVLAARFPGRHWAIIGGILIATIANHLLAAMAGGYLASLVTPQILRWTLGALFLGFAAWALIPDTLEEDGASRFRFGAFVTTLVLFFLAEMGDKTQLATAALGARYSNLFAVTLGTTLGMMAANVPAVLVGERLAQRFTLNRMRFVAAALFALFGVLILLDLDLDFGLGAIGL